VNILRIVIEPNDSSFDTDTIERYWMQQPDDTRMGYPEWMWPVKKVLEGFTASRKRAFKECNEKHVWLCVGICTNCKKGIWERHSSRSSFPLYGNSDLCLQCSEQRESIRKAEEEAQKKAKWEEKQRTCVEAVRIGVYESLNDLEFNFLLALVQLGNLDEAAKAVGLSRKFADKHFHKFVGLSLVLYDHPKWLLVDELTEALKTAAPRRHFKSVFGSPQAEKLYRALKKSNACVFPEVPLCAFISQFDAQPILDDWKKSGFANSFNYFLTCRIDFVVADREGFPLFCVEYDGSYHDDEKQKEKDQFKQELLAHAGISLRRISARELAELEKE
jgi:hypothetical protein